MYYFFDVIGKPKNYRGTTVLADNQKLALETAEVVNGGFGVKYKGCKK